MTRSPYVLDLCKSNGPMLVSREIANYLRRVRRCRRSPARAWGSSEGEFLGAR